MAGSNIFDKTKHCVAIETAGLPAMGEAAACEVSWRALTAAWGNSNPVPKQNEKNK